MFEFIFAILLGLACPTNTTNSTTSINDQTAIDHTGGDSGQLPPPK